MKTDSPIEAQFLDAIARTGETLLADIKTQHQIGPFRVDFALPALRVVIEVDGHAWHASREQRTRDARRDRYLTREGWTVLRYTGSEVFNSARVCARDLVDHARRVHRARLGVATAERAIDEWTRESAEQNDVRRREHDLAEVADTCLDDLDAHEEMRRRAGCATFADDSVCECAACRSQSGRRLNVRNGP